MAWRIDLNYSQFGESMGRLRVGHLVPPGRNGKAAATAAGGRGRVSHRPRALDASQMEFKRRSQGALTGVALFKASTDNIFRLGGIAFEIGHEKRKSCREIKRNC